MTSSQTDLLQAMGRAASPAAAIPRPRARWATRLLIPAAVLLAAGGILAYAARDALRPRLPVYVMAAIPKPSAAAANTSDLTGKPTAADAPPGPVAVQAPGWIEPAPFAVTVPALADGVIHEVLVLEGEQVEKGQVVARLIDEDAKLALRVAEAAVAQRASDIERAAAALATAQSQVLVERSEAEELRDEVERKRNLVATGGVGVGEFRRIEIRLGGLEARVATAERMVGEARAALAQAEAAREAGLVEVDQAALRLARMQVRSPVSGVVLARLVEPGSRISMDNTGTEPNSMSGAVLRVYDPARLQARVDVPLAEAAKVNIGTRATVSTEALADETFSGVVSRVMHEANIQRNTVQFKVAIDAPSPVLKPEMLVRVRLHGPGGASSSTAGSSGRVDTSDGGGGDMQLLVPTDAIVVSSTGTTHLWVVENAPSGPVARRRDVSTTPSTDDGFVVVTRGLRLTDRVILDTASLRDGARLNVLGERTATAPAPVVK